jgi:tetratricopeptide (TPR) repeat protein
MDFQLKPISKDGIAEALSKAQLYRYLNEPGEAESICRDILAADSENQAAMRLLGLSITDQFTGHASDRHSEAENTFHSLTDQYERYYYAGILHERQAKAQLTAGRSPYMVTPLFEKALDFFEKAEAIRPRGNDDAILRWNRCVRILQSRLGTDWQKLMETIDAGDSPPI